MPSKITVSIELSRVPMRVWMKAVTDEGHVQIIENIPEISKVDYRNKLLEKLSEFYDEVIGVPIPPRGVSRRITK